MKRIPLEERLLVRRSKIHGWGLFTLRDLKAGDMVIEYVGQAGQSTLFYNCFSLLYSYLFSTAISSMQFSLLCSSLVSTVISSLQLSLLCSSLFYAVLSSNFKTRFSILL